MKFLVTDERPIYKQVVCGVLMAPVAIVGLFVEAIIYGMAVMFCLLLIAAIAEWSCT